jgi:hypothetical protein
MEPHARRLRLVKAKRVDGLSHIRTKVIPRLALRKNAFRRHSAQYPPSDSCVTSNTISFTT